MKSNPMNRAPKIALVTDWMTSFGGEHRVLYALHEMFPDSPIYTTIYNKEELQAYNGATVRTSFLDRFPFAPLSKKKHQYFLPLMPLAFEAMDLSEYDIVISSNHSCSKGIVTKLETLHICYCHAPMRYVWEGCHRYVEENSPKLPGAKTYIANMLHKLRIWDRMAADRVDTFIANSNFIGRQIKKFYQKDATVIYPPINTGAFSVSDKREDYFLAGGRLIPNKKIDIAIEACNKLKLPLKVFGKGPDYERLVSMAGDTIEFLGFVSEEEITTLFGNAKAFIGPQLEDFGIVTVEAHSAGTPVVGLGRGGTAELVQEGVNGVLMEKQTVQSLVEALQRFETMTFDHEKIRQQALIYDVARFKREMKDFIFTAYDQWQDFLKT